MELSHTIFGDSAFCKMANYKRINKALFEIMSVTFAKLTISECDFLILKKNEILMNFHTAIITGVYKNSLTSDTGGKSNIALRHSEFNKMIQEILNPEPND